MDKDKSINVSIQALEDLGKKGSSLSSKENNKKKSFTNYGTL